MPGLLLAETTDTISKERARVSRKSRSAVNEGRLSATSDNSHCLLLVVAVAV